MLPVLCVKETDKELTEAFPPNPMWLNKNTPGALR